MNKVNILSMGWRSHWLAGRLKSLGIEVSLFEVTDYAGWSHPEDIDGPFPFAITLHSPEEFVNLAQIKDSILPLKSGFCISTDYGHLAWDSLNREQTLDHFKQCFEHRAGEAESFWFDDFLKSFGKSSFKKASLWSKEENSFNLNSDLYLRRSDRMTYFRSLELLAERGVKIHTISNLDLPKVLFEVKSNPREWIMGLTVSELKLLALKDEKAMSSHLGWHRKRFFYESKSLLTLPLWSVWLKSVYRPWKEDNLVIMIKGRQENYLDIWTIEDVYNPETKEKSIDKAHDFLRSNFRYVNFVPQQSENLEGALKTLFPIDNEKEIRNDINYIWNSPMEWRGYSMDLMYKYQYNLAQKLYDKGDV